MYRDGRTNVTCDKRAVRVYHFQTFFWVYKWAGFGLLAIVKVQLSDGPKRRNYSVIELGAIPITC